MHLLALGNVNAVLLGRRDQELCVIFIGGGGGAFYRQVDHIRLLGGSGIGRMAEQQGLAGGSRGCDNEETQV